ncbi:hypothetical protein CSA56_17330 [candidate division KSB3 bacterium]|uniref:Type 4 fimbrial biogenesis protein PilX N-terminal domain-containing protein n=1 Tax=candidate division KSB3 bacterium TaxID=2044937 RepID=A0A2G6K7Y8_9BACT|nr:MAG: hypothetical protein CSA56_17330 [candidate division KSB3 bacterium]
MRIYCSDVQQASARSQQGVALLTALFVLAIMSMIAAAVLSLSLGETKMSGVSRNSEKALKLAELGVQVARATIQEGAVSGSLASVDGFADGGYFFTSMGSGMPGNEKWQQWHYDSKISGNNLQSEITTPLRLVWMKEAQGRNGSFSKTNFYLNNIYGIIAGGAYFPIEYDTDTKIRAVDEYTGQEGVKYEPSGTKYYWKGDSNGDKSMLEGTISSLGYNKNYAVRMSPMGSYSNISSIPGQLNPRITVQTLYTTYAGDVKGGSASTSSDMTSTIRLRATNSLCNASDTEKVNTLWEFDTGIHGVATAPAVFDPSPYQPGDEIIYFAVAAAGMTNLRSRTAMMEYPIRYDEPDEGIYIFALVDTTSFTSGGSDECSKTGSYEVKWAHPFPDSNVSEWTDYPTEEATATNGMFPPYVRVSSDITPFLPEDDLLYDYRDSYYSDNMQNQMRGNLYMAFDPYSVSPVMLYPLYHLDGTNVNGAQMVTNERKDTISGVFSDPNDSNSTLVYGDPADPVIEIYLAYSAHTMVKEEKPLPHYNHSKVNWDRDYGLKKYSGIQTRVIALRDRLDGSCDSDGENCSWNWNSAKSRFPIFKWTYRLPANDPKRSDQRPWNGYGEFTWETWFEQQIAPMLGLSDIDQDGTSWDLIENTSGEKKAGQHDHYSLVYPAYESLGYPDGGGNYNNLNPPSGDGEPTSFDSTEKWDDSHIMIMGIRDTWDDYMNGHQTNPMWDEMVNNPTSDPTPRNPYAIVVKSSPVEPYWTHKHDGIVCETDGAMTEEHYPGSDNWPANEKPVINFSTKERDNWKGNTDKVGFPRPYVWNEALWQANVKGSLKRGLDKQGWSDSGLSTSNNSEDADVEGETSAFCRECLDGEGLIVMVFNHDLSKIEDLRMHAVNATSGKHVWDYHMPATLDGDYFNATPAIANGLVFVAYSSRSGDRKGAIMQVLDADTGEQQQEILFDDDPDSVSDFDGEKAGRADALLLPPTVANGAVYVGTYHFRDTVGTGSLHDDDSIRIYAFSPVFRMFSLGVYPLEYTNNTTIPELSTLTGKAQNIAARAERKIQVWITGSGSKWEEVREIQSVEE